MITTKEDGWVDSRQKTGEEVVGGEVEDRERGEGGKEKEELEGVGHFNPWALLCYFSRGWGRRNGMGRFFGFGLDASLEDPERATRIYATKTSHGVQRKLVNRFTAYILACYYVSKRY